MNNNFKKLLASAMALAMVTSVMPTIATTNVSAAACNLSDKKEAELDVEGIVEDLKTGGVTLDTVTFYTTEKKAGDWANMNSATNFHAYLVEFGTKYDGLKDCTLTGSLKKVYKFIDSVTKLTGTTGENGYIKELNDAFADGGLLKDGEVSDADWKDHDIKELYENIIAVEGYINNVAINTSAGHGAVTKDTMDDFKDHLDQFKDMVEAYKADYSDDFLKIYVEELKTKFADELSALENKTDYSRDNLKELKESLEKVLESDDYAKFSKEDEVVEIIDAIETMIENMETVNEILDSKVAKAIRPVRRDVAGYVAKTGEDALIFISTNFTEEEVEVIVNYVEDVVSEFYTYETKKRSVSGNYYVVEEATELAMYLNSGDVNADVRTMLKEIFEEKVADTYYDVLVEEDLTKVTKEELLEMVDAAKNIELKWNYTTSEAEKVWNGLYAVNKLLDNKAEYDVTAREARTLEKLKDKLELIDDRLGDVEADIEITKDWWVFENGQWVFYQDGKVAPNRWVADHNNDWYYAGANGVMLTNAWIARDSKLDVWYYVGADGKMVTNTTVDGCVIDANGVWHA